MNFVCIVFKIGDKMLTLSSMESLIVQCNLKISSKTTQVQFNKCTISKSIGDRSDN